jgi:ATP-dependent DNA helicase PIF1
MNSAPSTDEKISDEIFGQREILKLIGQRQNIFITGPGGTGKSYLLQRISTLLKEMGIVVAKTGSTGVAAENIGGMTIHSWAHVFMGDKPASYYFMSIQSKSHILKRWTKTDYLIIDEISMMGCKFFELLNQLGKLIRRNNEAVGGLKLIICGDVCQLPPIKDTYFFLSPEYKTMNFQMVRLSKPWRYQKDIEYFYLLSRARLGENTQIDINALEQRKTAYYKEIHRHQFEEGQIKPTRLYARRMDVNEMNLKELQTLPYDEYRYVATDRLHRKTKTSNEDPAVYQAMMDKNVVTSLSLKKDAQVMLTSNLDVEHGLCNGSRGVILECTDEYVKVRFKSGDVDIFPHIWTIEDESNEEMPPLVDAEVI